MQALTAGTSLSERARRELLRNADRPDSVIASLIGGSRGTVARARQLLAAAGLISGRAGRTPVPAIPQLPARPSLAEAGPTRAVSPSWPNAFTCP